MPTLLTTPPAEYDFIESAARAHESAGYDFPTIFDAFFTRHYIFKTPEFLLLGCEDPARMDAWLVWWAELHPKIATFHHRRAMLWRFLACMPHHRPYVGWARTLKGRRTVKYYSTDRLQMFTKIPSLTHAT